MKRLLFLLAFLCFLTPIAGGQAASLLGSSTSSETSTSDRSVFTTLSEINNAEDLLREKQIELRQAKDVNFVEEEEELSLLVDEIEEAEKQLEELEDPIEQEELVKTIEEKKSVLDKQTETLNERRDIQRQYIANLEQEIKDIEGDIERLQELAKEQAFDLLTRMLVILGFILLLLFLRKVVSKMLQGMEKIPLQRRKTLIRMNRIVFNVIIILSVIIAIFSQVASILPFLAILGTALAFALRDIISSFIAWFVIGTNQGYRIGDLIEVGEKRGRVMEVHPFLTTLRETGMRGETGRLMTFPNKMIFETEISNFSKMYRFTYIMIDFLFERGSNMQTAKQLLEKAIEEENAHDAEEAEKNLRNLQMKFGITAEQIKPQLFVEPDARGILLRGKYFCRLHNRHQSRSAITENFLQKLDLEKDIKLRFVEMGGEQ